MSMKKVAVVLMGTASFLFISLIILLLAVPSEDKVEHVKAEPQLHFSQAEYDQLEKKVINDSEGAILKIERNDIIFDVTVHDDWNKLSKSDRETVLNEIYKKIRNISVASELIGLNSNIDVLLINLNGEKLANKDAFGDVEIYE